MTGEQERILMAYAIGYVTQGDNKYLRLEEVTPEWSEYTLLFCKGDDSHNGSYTLCYYGEHGVEKGSRSPRRSTNLVSVREGYSLRNVIHFLLQAMEVKNFETRTADE